MSQTATLSFIGVLTLSCLHLLAGQLHRSAVVRPRWLAAASGMSAAYVFVHLLPELADAQAEWLIRRPTSHALQWLETQVYFAALIGVILALGLERKVRSRRRRQFWLHIAAFAVYNALIGGFALRLKGVVPLVLAVIAFGGHFLVNDHNLEVQFGPMYRRFGRWLLAGALLVGWALAVRWPLPALLVDAVLGLVSGGIILNVIKEEFPDGPETPLSPWIIGAVGYAVLILALTYVQRVS